MATSKISIEVNPETKELFVRAIKKKGIAMNLFFKAIIDQEVRAARLSEIPKKPIDVSDDLVVKGKGERSGKPGATNTNRKPRKGKPGTVDGAFGKGKTNGSAKAEEHSRTGKVRGRFVTKARVQRVKAQTGKNISKQAKNPRVKKMW
jgi:hypothetical protein